MVSKVKKALNKGSAWLKSLKIKLFTNQDLVIQNAKELLKETLARQEEHLEDCYEEIEILDQKLQEETAKGNRTGVALQSMKKKVEYELADHMINEIGILLDEESRFDSALLHIDSFRCLQMATSAATSALKDVTRDISKHPEPVAAVAALKPFFASDGN